MTTKDQQQEERLYEKDSHSTAKLGSKVKIKPIVKEKTEPEDYYYLKTFENQIGTITEKNTCKSSLFSYRIEFKSEKFGYFYDNDFDLIEN